MSGEASVVGLEVSEVGLWFGSRRSRRPPRISRDSGAGLLDGEYWGSGGAEVSLLVRTLISRFGWTMVILMLKGAIS